MKFGIRLSLQTLRIFLFVFLSITAFLWIFSFKEIFFTYDVKNNQLDKIAYLADMVYYFVLPFFVIIILINAQQNIGNLMFAAFLVINSLGPVFNNLASVTQPWLYFVLNILYGTLFFLVLLKTFQYFPKPITSLDIQRTFRYSFVQKLLKMVLNKATWIVYPLICIAVLIFPYQIPISLLYLITLLLIIAFLYTNAQKSTTDRIKVMLLFFGIYVYLATFILISIFDFFENQGVQYISDILSVFSVVALLFAFVMSLFFSDTFNTCVILKRTVINSFIFICIILIYNTAEHYFLHWVSHKLHISDVLVSSIFSGFLVLIFSPVHHKLKHFLEKRLKRKHVYIKNVGLQNFNNNYR